MVGCGDLAIEIHKRKFTDQRMMISNASPESRLIVATQCSFDDYKSRPTRAEVSDIARAI
jgi:pyruvate kinase